MTRVPTNRPPRKKKPKPSDLVPPAPVVLAFAPTPPSRESWVFSGAVHGGALLLILLLGLWQAPPPPPAEPVELVLDLTGAPAGDRQDTATDRAAPKDAPQRILPHDAVEQHADPEPTVRAPQHAPVAKAPPTEHQPAPEDLAALLAKREAAERERESARAGQLAAAAAHVPDAGEQHAVTSPREGGAVDSGSGLSGDLGQRQILFKEEPQYPRAAQVRGDEGDVRLRVWVSADGSVDRVELKSLSGTPELDRRAVEALKRWRFAPLPEGASPVTQWGDITMHFRLGRSE